MESFNQANIKEVTHFHENNTGVMRSLGTNVEKCYSREICSYF